jgi:hypothetical protein
MKRNIFMALIISVLFFSFSAYANYEGGKRGRGTDKTPGVIAAEVRADGFKAYNGLSEHEYEVRAGSLDSEGDPEHLLCPHKIVRSRIICAAEGECGL